MSNEPLSHFSSPSLYLQNFFYFEGLVFVFTVVGVKLRNLFLSFSTLSLFLLFLLLGKCFITELHLQHRNSQIFFFSQFFVVCARVRAHVGVCAYKHASASLCVPNTIWIIWQNQKTSCRKSVLFYHVNSRDWGQVNQSLT